jgi:ribonuclease J
VRPSFVIPNHGQYRHQMRFRKLARQWGINQEDVAITQLGERWYCREDGVRLTDTVKAGEVYIAGDGTSDLSRRTINERLAMAQDGMMIFSIALSEDGSEITSPPQLVSRGFLPEKEAPELFRELEQAITDSVLRNRVRTPDYALQLRNNVQNAIQRVIFQKTRFNPIVIGMVHYAGAARAAAPGGIK